VDEDRRGTLPICTRTGPAARPSTRRPAATAAAEYGRDSGGFEKLLRATDDLTKKEGFLLELFQPTRRARPFFRILTLVAAKGAGRRLPLGILLQPPLAVTLLGALVYLGGVDLGRWSPLPGVASGTSGLLPAVFVAATLFLLALLGMVWYLYVRMELVLRRQTFGFWPREATKGIQAARPHRLAAREDSGLRRGWELGAGSGTVPGRPLAAPPCASATDPAPALETRRAWCRSRCRS
jgi:hypothetical protein